jgi:hypothetical protein
VGPMPAKADGEAQETFKTEALEPRLAEAPMSLTSLLVSDE